MMKRPVEGHPDLVRDMRTGMITNINRDKVRKVKAIREKRQNDNERIDRLESDISDIKTMLKQLIENGNG